MGPPTFPPIDEAAWRAQVDKELARTPGASFDTTLVHTTAEGIALQPLYTEIVGGGAGPAGRRRAASGARIVTRLPADATGDEVARELAGGADGVWLPRPGTALAAVDALAPAERPFVVLDVHPSELEPTSWPGYPAVELAVDAIGQLSALEKPLREGVTALVSTLPYHDAGGDAVDELGFALATGRAYFARLLEIGMTPELAMRTIAFRITVDRDTFTELCKLRALRLVWQKFLTAAGVSALVAPRVHAVSATRTLTERDPWVNLLRVATQSFAAICGGADLVTPAAFDGALVGGEAASPLGRRIARNTGLVLRDESFLGRVGDPAGGAYFFESLTLELARRGWTRFREIEKEGGMVEALGSGFVARHLSAARERRRSSIATRRTPILGVSEFAQLDETLPAPVAAARLAERARGDDAPALAAKGAPLLPRCRDAEGFEVLRDRADAAAVRPEALLLRVGSFAESRARVGFARQLFAAAGIASRETHEVPAVAVPLVCLCGSDDSYAAHAVPLVRALKALGCGFIHLAGRPRALEASLREAGVEVFVFAGCGALVVLTRAHLHSFDGPPYFPALPAAPVSPIESAR